MTTLDAESKPVPCPECGYDLRGHGDAGRCPECGRTITESDLDDAGLAPPDPATAVERSGLGLVAAASWSSAILLSGLLELPLIGGVLLLAAFFGCLARLIGAVRLRRGPLPLDEDPRLAPIIAWITSLELALVTSLVLVVLGIVPVPRIGWIALLGTGIVLGGGSLATLGWRSHRVGRATGHRVLGFVGGLGTVLPLLAVLASLAINGHRVMRPRPGTGIVQLDEAILVGGVALCVLLAVAAAHVVRVALLGVQSILLDEFLERRDADIDGMKVGGSWIRLPGSSTVASDPLPREPSEDPLPLAPRRPPVRSRERRDDQSDR